jgi:hypothetical protein
MVAFGHSSEHLSRHGNFKSRVSRKLYVTHRLVNSKEVEGGVDQIAAGDYMPISTPTP